MKSIIALMLLAIVASAFGLTLVQLKSCATTTTRHTFSTTGSCPLFSTYDGGAGKIWTGGACTGSYATLYAHSLSTNNRRLTLSSTPPSGYTYEGIVGCVSPPSAIGGSLVQYFELYSSTYTDYRYAAGTAQRDQIMAWGYTNQGVIAKVEPNGLAEITLDGLLRNGG